MATFMSRKPPQHRQYFCFAVFTILMLTWLPIPHASSQTPAPTATSNTPIAAANKPPTKTSPAATATTVDPNVTVAHLKLFVKPLTVKELEVEAKGWQNLLKRNVQNITSLHIRIEQFTAQIAQLRKSTSLDEIKPTSRDTTSTAQANGSQNSPTPPADPANSPAQDPASANSAISTTDPVATDPVTTDPVSAQPKPATIESLTNARDAFSEQLTELNR